MNKIKLLAEDEKELFHSYDPDEESFTDDIKSYLLHCLKKIDADREITLQVISAQPISEERIQKAADNWIKEEKEEIREQNRENMIHQLWMFGIGIVFLSISIILQPKVDLIWYTILSTIGSLSIWEAASVWIVENPKLRKHLKTLEKLEKNIRFSVVPGR